MKLCFSTLGCTEQSLKEILAIAETYDIHALEIRGMDGIMDNRQIEALSEQSAPVTKEMFAKGNVVPRVLGTSCAFHDPGKYDAAVAEGKACIDIAERFEIPYIRVFGNKLIGETLEERVACYARVAAGIAELCQYAIATSVTVLLEAMAGKGSEIGGTFEELKDIIDGVGSNQVGVCLDTCHIWDAGYDIVNDLDGVLQEFDRVVGLDKLCALHLNDSKNPLASHKDRHECIGDGNLGLATFEKIINHPVLAGLPMILETPNELPGYAREIAMLREMERGAS